MDTATFSNPFAAIAAIIAFFLALVAIVAYLWKAVAVFNHLRRVQPDGIRPIQFIGALGWGIAKVAVTIEQTRGAI